MKELGFDTFRERNEKMRELWDKAREATANRDIDDLDEVLPLLRALIEEDALHTIAEEEGKPWPPER